MRAIPMTVALAMLAACSGAEESGTADIASEASSSPAAETSSDGSMALAESGWLVVGGDGAVYTTMLDAGGTYRDFRNGEPVGNGQWERRENGDICFSPSDTSQLGDCWSLGSLEQDNTIRATSSDNRAVELRKVAYLGTPEDGAADIESEE